MKKLLITFICLLGATGVLFAGSDVPQLIVTPVTSIATNWIDDTQSQWGTGTDFVCEYDTAQTPDAMVCGVSSDSRNWIVTEKADVSIDFGHALQTNPTLWIHSADATDTNDYISFAHNQSNALFRTGTGSFDFNALTQYSTGLAITAGSYQIGRDADATNQLHFNVPTGAGMEWSINDVAGMTLDATSMVRTQAAGTSGVPTAFTLTGAAHTGLTAATEDIGVNFNFSATKTWEAGAGPLANQREIYIQAPTYVGNAGGALTISDAYTVYISGSPTQGANITLTRPWGLGVNANVGVGAGTALLPSYSFIGDPDTGIYSAAANTIGFTVGGVNVLRLSADAGGSAVFNSSSATAGSQYHQFRATGDELAIGTGGFATHNVGIWTSLSNSGTPAFLMRYGGGGTRSFQLVGDYTFGQTQLGLSGVQGLQMNFTDSLNASKDHDHALQTNPTIYVHSALDPDVSNNQWGSLAHDQEDFIISTGAETGTGTGATTDRNAICLWPRGAAVLCIAGLATSGVPTSLLLTGSAHTGITAATEAIGVNFNLSQTKTWAAGAGPLATQREILFQAPTYAGNAGGALTITNAATVSITGAPAAGANITLTNSYALWVDDGASRFDDRILGFKGADVTPAATVTLGKGNFFNVAASVTAIDCITTTGWTAGAEVTFIFAGVSTINDSTGGCGANTANIDLTAAFISTAGDTLKIIYNGTNWSQTASSVN
mgnify:CR=1 FL=1